jgi:Sulfotransferase domain
VVLFASAGRCGTQWIAKALQAHYSDLVRAEHEPLTYRYAPRSLMRTGLSFAEHPNFLLLMSHLADISVGLGARSYVETGWPMIGALPLFDLVFGESAVAVVHLSRDPVTSACSMVTHNYYMRERSDGYASYAILRPDDPGVSDPRWAELWPTMDAFERCLFHWFEVNSYAREYTTGLGPDRRWVHVRYEDIFDPVDSSSLVRLLEFLGLPARQGFLADISAPFDLHRATTDGPIEVEKIHRHPQVLDLARELGHDVTDVDVPLLHRRYCADPRTPGPGVE